MSRRARVFTLLSVVTALSCQSSEPVEPSGSVNFDPIVGEAAVETAANFYFLPPLVAASEFTGEFDGSLDPTVEICELMDDACAETLVTYGTDGAGSEAIRVDPEGEHYHVNWHVRRSGAEVGKTYRIMVSVDGEGLGSADVAVAAHGGGHGSGVNVNRTVPIKFRIEQADENTPEPAQADIMLLLDERDGMSAENYALQLDIAREFVGAVSLGPDAIQFGIVSIGDNAQLVQALTGNASTLLNAINALTQQGGSGDLSAGIQAAVDEFNNSGRPDAPQVLVICTVGPGSDDANQVAADFKDAGGIVIGVAIGDGTGGADALGPLVSAPEYLVSISSFAELTAIVDMLLAGLG